MSTMHDVAESEQHVSTIINEVISEVGMFHSLSTAQRAHRCADALLDKDEPEALRWIVVSGWERELSKQLTAIRRDARKAAQELSKQGKTFASGNGLVARQLAYSVVAPGMAVVPLARAHHALLLAALAAEESQLRGREVNINLLRRSVRATEPFPGQTIADLLASGLISLGQIFEEQEATG